MLSTVERVAVNQILKTPPEQWADKAREIAALLPDGHFRILDLVLTAERERRLGLAPVRQPLEVSKL